MFKRARLVAFVTPAATALALTSCTNSPGAKSTAPVKSIDVGTMSPQQLAGLPRDSPGGAMLINVTGRGSRSEQPIKTTTGNVLIWLNCPGTDRAVVTVGPSSTTIECSIDRDAMHFIEFSGLPRTLLPVVVDTGAKTPWRLQVVQTST